MKEVKIPESIDVDIFVVVDVLPSAYSFGQIAAYSFDIREAYKEGNEHHKYVLLTKMKVTVPIPPSEFDPVKEAVQSLEERKTMELAEHHMRMKELDDQLMELRTITYQPDTTWGNPPVYRE